MQFDAAAIQRLHKQRLTALLGHAWSTTEYYRQVLSDAGAVRNGVVDLARFQDIPFLTRDIVREQFSRLTSRSLPEGRRPIAMPPAARPGSRPSSCRTMFTGT